jgi:hypothetical protein
LRFRLARVRSLDAVHGRVAGVLDLDPVVAATRAVGSIAAFRHYTLQSHVAGCAEEIGSDLTLLERADEDSVWPAR